MKNARIAATFFMALSAALMIVGCSKDSPVGPTTESGDPSGCWTQMYRGPYSIQGTNTMPSDPTTVTDVTAIVWPYPNTRTDILADSVYVTPWSGGTVKVKWSNWDPYHFKLSTVSFTLMIPPGAVPSPKMISIRVDKNDPEISAEFGPSGLVFLKPALLDVQACGLNLSAFRPTDRLDLWYVNSTGWVGTMQYSRFFVDVPKGNLLVSDVQIPHFSRYCFGR